MNNNLSLDTYRVIDANLNRLKEGIRVVEDILRYKQNNKTLAQQLKALRHKAAPPNSEQLLQYRDSVNDVLRPSTKSEQNRSTLRSVVTANFKRAQESSRVLEELYKLIDIDTSELYKKIRYDLYTIEKEVMLEEF